MTPLLTTHQIDTARGPAVIPLTYLDWSGADDVVADDAVVAVGGVVNGHEPVNDVLQSCKLKAKCR